MRHPHRTAPIVVAVVVLPMVSGCGHRPSFQEAADAVFGQGPTTGMGTGGITGDYPSTSVTEGCSTNPLQVVINGHDMMPGYNEPAKPEVDALMG
ncbi:MAG: hypothetical protein JW751_11070, partial [Polyangiaceae bacterium]|nr:hypothetical protein [Polyangiaceae bacterium]